MNIVFWLLIIVLIALGVIFVLLIIAAISIAPWLPIRSKDLSRLADLAQLQAGQTFCELGCGDGRACFYVAKAYPQAKIIGLELFWPLYLLTKIKALLLGRRNVQIKFADALNYDLSTADVIYVFGTTYSMNQALKNKFIKELKPGAKVISYVFKINDWPGKSQEDKPKNSAAFYVYQR